MKKSLPEQLLTPREAARLLGYRSTSTLLLHDAQLQPIRTLGGQRRYERAKIEAALRKAVPQQRTVEEKTAAAMREIDEWYNTH